MERLSTKYSAVARVVAKVILALISGAVVSLTLIQYWIEIADQLWLLIIVGMLSGFGIYVLLTIFLKRLSIGPTKYWLVFGSVYFAVAAIGFVFLQPLQSPAPIGWMIAMGPNAHQPLVPISGNSWDRDESALLELHASSSPDLAPWGPWSVRSAIPTPLAMVGGTISFELTQPSWAVLDPATLQPVSGPDGVLVNFYIAGPTGVDLQTSIDLDNFSGSPGWHSVRMNVPPGSKSIKIEVLPKETILNDRVWVTTGEVDSWLERFYIPLNVLFVLLLSMVVAMGTVIASWPLVRLGRYLDQSAITSHFWVLTVLISVALGYLLVWRQGLYLDDVSLKSIAIDPITGERLPIFDPSKNPNYPARILTWILLPQVAALVPEHEFLARLLLAMLFSLNALLVGFLVFTILESKAAGVIATWLFLMPMYTDVPLWISAIAYPIANALSIFYLYCNWKGLGSERHYLFWFIGGTAAFIVALLFGENSVAAFGLVPVLSLIALVRHRQPIRQIVLRVVVSLLISGAGIAAIFRLLYSQSAVVRNRQGISLDLASIVGRILAYMTAIQWWTIDPTWGQQLVGESFWVGLIVIWQSGTGIALATALCCSCLLMIATWREPQPVKAHTIWVGLSVMGLGMLWMLAMLFVPYTLAQAQMFERRYFYSPGAGMAVMVATAIWLIMRGRPAWLQKLILVFPAAILIVMTICMTGFAQVYALRNALTQQQLSLLVQSVPSESLPAHTRFVPLANDERLFDKNNVLTQHIFSALETPYSGQLALQSAFKRRDIALIASNRWGPTRFEYDRQPAGGGALKIQGEKVQVEEILPFTYRDKQILLIKQVVISDENGNSVVIKFPLSKKFSDLGTGSLESLEVKGVIR